MTFLEIQNLVRGIVIDLPTFVTTAVPDLINKAMRDLQDDHEFKVQGRDTATLTTTEGTRTLTSMPTGFKRFRGLPFELLGEDDVAAGQRELIASTERTDTIRMFDVDEEGAPQMILDTTMTDDDGTRVLEVWPLPDGLNPGYDDGEYRIVIPYWSYVAELSLDADTNWFTANAPWYLIFQAAAEGFFLDWDYQGGAVWVQKASVEKARVVKADKMYRLGDVTSFVPHKDVYAPKAEFRGGFDHRYYGYTKM